MIVIVTYRKTDVSGFTFAGLSEIIHPKVKQLQTQSIKCINMIKYFISYKLRLIYLAVYIYSKAIWTFGLADIRSKFDVRNMCI